MARRRRRPIKRGPSRLTHYADPEIERLRREVDEEIRRLRHLPDEEEGPVECCEQAFLIDGSRAMTAAFDAGGFNITNVGTVDGVDISTTVASLAPVAFSGAAADVSGLAAVATSGSASDLGTGTLPIARIADGAVTLVKLADLATDRLLGRDTAGTGAVEAISVGGGVEFTGSSGIQRSALTGDVTASAGSASTTIANDAVTNAKFRDSGARSVIGRSANSTGDPADISGNGTSAIPTVVSDNGSTLAFRSMAELGDRIIWDVDLSSLATNAFTDGTEVINGISFTVSNSSRAGSEWGISNGSGMVISAPASTANTWATSSLSSAPYLYTPLSSFRNIDYSRPIIIDFYLSSSTFENGNDCIRVGLWGVAASPTASYTARARIGDRGNHSGTQNIRVFDGTTVTAHADAHNFNSISIRIDPSGAMYMGVGTYSSGWPDFSYEHVLATALSATTLLAQPTARLAIIWINASDASPTSRVTIARMRIRQ